MKNSNNYFYDNFNHFNCDIDDATLNIIFIFWTMYRYMKIRPIRSTIQYRQNKRLSWFCSWRYWLLRNPSYIWTENCRKVCKRSHQIMLVANDEYEPFFFNALIAFKNRRNVSLQKFYNEFWERGSGERIWYLNLPYMHISFYFELIKYLLCFPIFK